MNEFIIVFRECLEASLIVGIIYSFLSRSNLHEALKKLWLGVGASVIASIFVAILVVYLKSTVGDTRYEKLFEALFMYCLLYTSPSPRDGTSSRMPSSA